MRSIIPITRTSPEGSLMSEPSAPSDRGPRRVRAWVEPAVVETVRMPANRSRPVPSPWLDCGRCGWRHYPGFEQASWKVVTACASCSAPLPER